jgi:hypothetical protein
MLPATQANNSSRPLVHFEIPYRGYDIIIIASAILTMIGIILVNRFPHVFFKNVLPNLQNISKIKVFLITLPAFLGAFGCFKFVIIKACHIGHSVIPTNQAR